MLDRSRLNPDSNAGDAIAGVSRQSFSDFIAFVRRQAPVLAAAALAAIALGAFYLVATPPSFTAEATMVIDSRKVQLLQQQSIMGDIPVDAATVESQVEIVKSENITLKVIKDLRLTQDPEFTGSTGGLIGAVLSYVAEMVDSKDARSEYDLTRRALRTFENRLTVKRVGLTYLIQISFRSYDPQRAADIANAIAEAYIFDQLEAKYQATRRATGWLQDRIQELRQQTSTAERAVVDFKAKNNIVDAGGRLLNEQQLAELNSQLLVARGQTSEARARYNRIQTVLGADPTAAVIGTVADTFNNQVVTKLRSQFLELANREADWSARYGANHLASVNLRSQMREISRSIRDELQRLSESYKSDLDIAQQREDNLSKNLSEVVGQSQTTNQAQVTLRELESSAQTYRTLYDNFLQRYMESIQQQSFPITEARLISPASKPIQKSSPQTLLTMVMSAFAGLLVGVGVGALRDLSDRVFRTGEQVEKVLNAPCLAMLPRVKARPMWRATAKEAASFPPRTILQRPGIAQMVLDEPFSRFVESLRAIKVAADLQGAGAGRQQRVIGFTSSLPNEGKSSLSSAFAQMIAKSGASVILVDADLRNPSLTAAFTPRAKAGCLEMMSGAEPLEDVVWTDHSSGMQFLPAVVRGPMAQSSEALGSPAMRKLVERLRERYDYVVIDLSPLAPIVDVRLAAPLVDHFVYTVEWGRTKVDVVEHCLHHASEINNKVLGFVLNKASMRQLERYDGYKRDYYSNKGYARYGYVES